MAPTIDSNVLLTASRRLQGVSRQPLSGRVISDASRAPKYGCSSCPPNFRLFHQVGIFVLCPQHRDEL